MTTSVNSFQAFEPNEKGTINTEHVQYLKSLRESTSVLPSGKTEKPFEFLDSLNEITPTEKEMQLPLMKAFLRDVTGEDDPKHKSMVPQPCVHAKPLYIVFNVRRHLSFYFRERIMEYVFGFVIFFDAKYDFIRANSHVWLRHKNNPEEWMDPNPLIDAAEPSGMQMYVECPSLFTNTERSRIMTPQVGERFILGAITNKDIINPILADRYGVKIINHFACIAAKDLRLVVHRGSLENMGNIVQYPGKGFFKKHIKDESSSPSSCKI